MPRRTGGAARIAGRSPSWPKRASRADPSAALVAAQPRSQPGNARGPEVFWNTTTGCRGGGRHAGDSKAPTRPGSCSASWRGELAPPVPGLVGGLPELINYLLTLVLSMCYILRTPYMERTLLLFPGFTRPLQEAVPFNFLLFLLLRGSEENALITGKGL